MIKLIGALTSKPYAFKARPWELENISSLDYHDASGTNIQVSIRGSQILRVLPRINNHINEEWISDKIRFSYDAFSQQRLFNPLLKVKGQFNKISWQEAFDIIKQKYKESYSFRGIYGNVCDTESILLFAELIRKIGTGYIENQVHNLGLSSDLRQEYLMNTNYDQIDNADLCTFIGANPRFESPLLNLKIRKNVLKGTMGVITIGHSSNLTYPAMNLNNSTKTILSLIEGKSNACQKIVNAIKPVGYLGTDALHIKNTNNLVPLLKELFSRTNDNNFNVLHQHSSTVMGLEINAHSGKSTLDFTTSKEVLYLYNTDELNILKGRGSFVIYQGHIGDRGAELADLILPGSNPLEKNGSLINNEGIKQNLNFCVTPPANARNDWKIFEALANYLELAMHYQRIDNISSRISEIAPTASGQHRIEVANKGSMELIDNAYILSSIDNFYMTDIISRNSSTLALAKKRFDKQSYNFIN